MSFTTCFGCSKCSETCVNDFEDDDCARRLAVGGCHKDRDYMFDNCQKACNWCDKRSSDEIEDEEIDGNKRFPCTDSYGEPDKCKKWATTGECRKNAVWMIPNCRKSCNKCSKEGVCMNLYVDTQCDRWSSVRECRTNPIWMRVNCKRSCNMCDETETEIQTDEERREGNGEAEEENKEKEQETSGECRNRNSDENCNTWAHHGHCKTNPSYMRKHCREACRVCKPNVDETNVDTSTTSATTAATTRPTTTLPTTIPTTTTTTTTTATTTTTSATTTTTITTTTRRTTIFTIGPTTTNEPHTTTNKNEDTCFDTNENCASWAKYGYCESNPRYNLVNCRLSCKNCNGCRDEHLLCKVWAKGGQCKRNVRYMLRNCQMSCRVCAK